MDLTYNELSDTIELAELDQNFSDVVTALGDLYGSDFARKAGLDKLQLANRYQDTFYVLGVRAENLAGGWPAVGTVVDAQPFLIARETIAAVCQISVAITDIGTPAGAFKVGIRDPLSSTVTYLTGNINLGAGAANTGDTFDVQAPPLEFDNYWDIGGQQQMKRQRYDVVGEIFLESTFPDAAALSAAGSFANVTVMVRRYLRSS